MATVIKNENQNKTINSLVGEALNIYGIKPIKIVQLRTKTTSAYRIFTSKKQFLLKLHYKKYSGHAVDKKSLSSMLELTNMLREKGFHVQNSRFPVLILKKEDTTIYCLLMSWIDGKNISIENPNEMYNSGKLIASIHNYLDSINLRGNFIRSNYDRNYYSEMFKEYSDSLYQNLYSDKSFSMVSEGFELALEALFNEYSSYFNYGLVHGDFSLPNVLSTMEGIAIIDFDFSGYGHRARDLSDMLFNIQSPYIIQSFLRGYFSEGRKVSSKEITSALLLTTIDYNIQFVANHSFNLTVHKMLAAIIQGLSKLLINNSVFEWANNRPD